MRREKGFTLIELLVVMAISGVVMAGIYQVYFSQQKSYMVQERVVAMQQNLRAAMFFMEREIRMAGCDPKDSANAGITTANSNRIDFTEDIRGKNIGDDSDGDTNDANESISYALIDGDNDGQIDDLGRDTGSGYYLLAENIEVIDFVYLNAASAVIANPNSSLGAIRTVQITLVAKTAQAERGYTDTDPYYNQQGGAPILPAQNDNFRRKLLTTTINCRNLGL